ncbi:MAG: substrate-binding domain-containing protein [Rhodobacteraceae bacterium]|nr:substrate-binding domain-containing protein [Paracoccaceae bacterium]
MPAGDRAGADVGSRFRRGNAELVRFNGARRFMDGVIAAMIGGFRSARPKPPVVQTHGYAQKLIERLNNGTLDFAVCPSRADAASKPLTFRRILPGVNVIACRVKQPLTRRSAVRPSDLARNPWVALPPDSPPYMDPRRALPSTGKDDFRTSVTGGSQAAVVSILPGFDIPAALPYSVVFMFRKRNPTHKRCRGRSTIWNVGLACFTQPPGPRRPRRSAV